MSGWFILDAVPVPCMQQVRMTGRPREGFAPPIFHLFADPPGGDFTRLLDWNLGDGSRPTALLETDGDGAAFRQALSGLEPIDEFDLHVTNSGQTYCFLSLEPDPDSEMARIFDLLSREGLIVVKPIVYRDGAVHATWVGESEVLQATIAAMPEAVDVEIEAVGGLTGGNGSILESLSVRQREALEAALEVGYYDRPRTATHEDVARAMDCAPSTASEHLLKAESKLVRAAFERFG